MRQFFEDGEAGKKQFANELGEALEGIGFAILTGHEIDEKLYEIAEQKTIELFETTTVKERMKYEANRFGSVNQGYFPIKQTTIIHPDLVEGWVRLAAGNLEIKAGRQIVVWGRADRLNPTDNISSRDYTLLVASDDEQRRGAAMVQTRLGLGPYTLDAYWLPEFRPNRFPLDRNVQNNR